MTKGDKKEVGQIVGKAIADAFVKFWEQISPMLATKQDLETIRQEMATKKELSQLDFKVDKLSIDVRDIRRRVIDMEADTPSRTEFDRLTTRVDQLTN